MNDAKITAMSFVVEMDRPLKCSAEEESPYYISPGGYEINGKRFDFCCFGGETQEDTTKADFQVWDLDTDYTEDIPTKSDFKTNKWEDFFIFTGEGSDPEIYAKKICSVFLEFEDGSHMYIDSEGLAAINAIVEGNYRDAVEKSEMEERS